MSMDLRLRLTSALLVLAAPCVAHAQQPSQPADVAALIKVFSDDGQPLEKRHEALDQAATFVSRQSPPRAGPLEAALGPVLDRTVGKRTDPAMTRFLVLLLRSTELFLPMEGMAPRVKPLLARDTPDTLRNAALRAVQLHRVAGVAPELEAYMREGGKERGREGIERLILDAAADLPVSDCTRVVGAALEVSKFRGVRIYAARTLGEKRDEVGRRALVKAVSAEERDELIVCEAATALMRHGSLEGAGGLVARLKARPSPTVYAALCRTAMREHEGFGGLLAANFIEAGKEARTAAIAAAVEWWEGSRPRTRDDIVFDAIKARGVNVPANRQSKEAITALIDALTIDPSSVRYAALDLLVERTGKTELAEYFRTLVRSMRGSAGMLEEEPTEGFPDEMRREMLKEQQGQKQAKWRSWWDSVKGRAENINGKWVVRG